MLLPLALLAFLLALFLFWTASRRQRAAGLPGGRIIYADTQNWKAVEEPLYDSLLGLTGRPDYLVRQGSAIIPVEVKTGRSPAAPYDAHIYQLAAYCVLVERVMGTRPPYGIISYTRHTFAVDYTSKLENAFLDLFAEMRTVERKRSVDRSHDQPARCRGCGYRDLCDQRL